MDVYCQAISENKRAAHNSVIDLLVSTKNKAAAAQAAAG
jgi:hypothetical protein